MERCLVDTNVVIRLLNREDPAYLVARNAVDKVIDEGYRLCITPQILAEFWNVATRPKEANGLGWDILPTLRETFRAMDFFETLYVSDSLMAFTYWLALLIQYEVKGKQVHDARLVATMLTHGVHFLLTFNGDDFRRYGDLITIIDANTP